MGRVRVLALRSFCEAPLANLRWHAIGFGPAPVPLPRGNWDLVERAVGVSLPADYKLLGSAYADLLINDDLVIFNFSAGQRDPLTEQQRLLAAIKPPQGNLAWHRLLAPDGSVMTDIPGRPFFRNLAACSAGIPPRISGTADPIVADGESEPVRPHPDRRERHWYPLKGVRR
jgi:hypothetical protein